MDQSQQHERVETSEVQTSLEKQGDAKEGRDDKGRFAAGNKGGPGNPFARQTAANRQAVVNAVTEQDL